MGWAFLEELPLDRPNIDRATLGPSAPRPGWAAMAGAGDVKVSDGEPALSGWGVVSAHGMRDPYPDARAVGRAVFGLDDMLLDMPADWAADEGL